jgi:riboflavin kinase
MDRNELLIKLSQMGALERYVLLTTRELGEIIGVSQQSASLYLQRLEEEGLVQRVRRKRGTALRITKEGLDQLTGLYGQLRSLFETSRDISVRGAISTGLGEGAYYLSQEGYTKQIGEKFGMEPFRGTLNVVLTQRDAPVIDLLRRGPGIQLEGFSSGGRSFGSCLCYPCKVNGIDAVVMVPNRTVHTSIIEIVASARLRETLSLNDGDEVDIAITYPAFE